MTENENPTDDLTRREWILRLGELVALAGVSGMVPELASAFTAPQVDASTLSPGLYAPSQDHLVHALSSGGKNWSPPPGSETEYVEPGSASYHPQFFSPEEFATVTRFISILLGQVDRSALSQAAQWFDRWVFSSAGVRSAARNLDPLHRALAVAYYGEDSVRELETADPQEMARVGLRALQSLSSARYNRTFLQLPENEQVELVRASAESQAGTGLQAFFGLARSQATRGYYTTASGLEELDYRGNAYYTECPGCARSSTQDKS